MSRDSEMRLCQADFKVGAGRGCCYRSPVVSRILSLCRYPLRAMDNHPVHASG